jgi:hypothetical protein
MEKKITLLLLVFFVCSSVSANALSSFDEDSLTIYPNPAKDYLKIELKSDDSVMPLIRLIDLTGKVILKLDRNFSREPELHKAELNISKLNSGIYFVKVIQGESTYTKKLIVK